MATEFTIFSQLITELRLEIWRLALPAPLRRPLYPYKKGCWVVEEKGLEPGPDGEDLRLEFHTSRLDPLQIKLPLAAVNREAREVAIKYVREQKLSIPRGSTQSDFTFLRHFDSRTDTMFLPTPEIETFIVDQSDRLSEPDVEGHHYSTDYPLLQRLAITAPGLKFLKEELEGIIDISAPIYQFYLVDVACDSAYSLKELENASKHIPLDLEDGYLARLSWRSSQREWETSGDEKVLAMMRQLAAGLDDPRSSTSRSDLDIELVHLNTRELALT